MPFNINNKTVFGGYLPLVAKHLNRASALGAIVEDPDKLDRSVYQLQTAYNTSTLENAMAALIDPSLTGYVPGVNNGVARLLSLFPQSDVLQTTAANQPLLLRWNSGEGNYYYSSIGGIGTGNRVETPDALINRLNNNINIIAFIDFSVNDTTKNIYSKKTALAGIEFNITNAGDLSYRAFYGGVVSVSSSTQNIPTVKKCWVRVTRNSISGQVTFFYSLNDVNDVPSSWIQLGSAVVGPTGAADPANTPCAVGSYSNSGSILIYRCFVNQNLADPYIISFNANDYNINISQNTFVSKLTGETWTINYISSTTRYKGQLVYKTCIQFDGINDSLRTSVDTLVGLVTSEYLSFSLFNLTAGQRIKDGSIANTGEVIKAATGYNITQGSAPLATQLAFRIVCNIHKYDDQLNQAYIKVNGVTQFSGTTNQNVRLLTLGASGAITAFSNFMFNSYIASKQYDGLVREQIINNLIKQLNGFTN